MVETWRIVKQKHHATAFTGQSASERGGRWNSEGTRLIYTASSTSLALLEILVNLRHSQTLASYYLYRVTFPAEVGLDFDLKSLPANWRDRPPPVDTQVTGDKWVSGAASAVLSVPSTIVPHERKYLLNPAHSDFTEISVGAPHSFPIDERLLESSK